MTFTAGSLEDQIAFTKSLVDTYLETKSKQRYVRTPEGSRKYKLPIGAPITGQALGKVARAAARRSEQVLGNKPDAGLRQPGDNNKNVPYRVIRQDKDLKGVDLKSGEFTGEFLADLDASAIRRNPDGEAIRTDIGITGYRYDFNGRKFRYVKNLPASLSGIGSDLDDLRTYGDPVASGYTYEDNYEITWTNPTIGKNEKIDVRLTQRPPRGKEGAKLKYVATLETGRRRGGGYRQFLAESPKEAFEAAARAMVLRKRRMTENRDEYDAEGMWPVNRKSRDYDGVFENWPGIRGWDFTLDDEDADVDFSNRNERYKLAHKDAREMGFEWANKGNWSRDDGSSHEMPVEVMESVNALMRAHDERYPGIAQMFNQIGMMRDDWATAYNGGGTFRNDVFAHTVNVMGMNERFFSDNNRGARDAAANALPKTRLPDYPAWLVNDGDDNIGKRIGDESMTEQQKLALSVMTHEIGHTVGYILQGRVLDIPGGKHKVSFGKEDNSTVTAFHRKRMMEILEDYGMFDPKAVKREKIKKLPEPIDPDKDSRVIELRDNLAKAKANGSHDGRSAYSWELELDDRLYDIKKDNDLIERERRVVERENANAKFSNDNMELEWMLIGSDGFAATDPFNRQAISEHLSEYAATNVSEIMAETWSAYHSQENPGDYVREMGELMEAALDDYLAETDLTKMPKPRSIVEARKAKGLPTWDNTNIIDIVASRGGGGDRNKDTESIREKLAKTTADTPPAEKANVMNTVFMPSRPKEFFSLEKTSKNPPELVLRKLKMDSIDMFVDSITDELISYNFDTDQWENV